ncbi:MAG: DUF6209 family protein, partial [Deltaproteobacteria bacterium]
RIPTPMRSQGARVVVGLVWIAAMASGLVACAADDGVDPGESTVDEVRRVRPRAVGPLAVGDNPEGSLIGTTPDGYALTLHHARAVTLRVYTLPGAHFDPALRIYGPLADSNPGAALPGTALREAQSPAGAGGVELRDVPLAEGNYVVTVSCAGRRCRGQGYAIGSSWGEDPSVAATADFHKLQGARADVIVGAPVRGRGLAVRYDATRYALNQMTQFDAEPACRMAVTLYYRQTPGEAFAPYALEAAGSGPVARDTLSAVIPVRDGASEVEMFFQATQAGRSCFNPNPEVWDTNGGRNFHVAIPDAVIHLTTDGATLDGLLHRGGTVAVTYDLGRLTRQWTCRGSYNGMNLVSASLRYRFDGAGDFSDALLARPASSEPTAPPAGPFTPTFTVPEGARDLELYAHGTAFECEAWDSNWSRNFHFDVR